uniref:uncharacterized protein LOC113474577 n=1 Tax=Ciona intestinalis TaxID=7719 RepID=UPI000EF463CE|nr:uncharacterized protein LOC113474577 [Ciona intestinalis]|eukprot:XP_026692040.1 uncharacterized protein LOC113474577 [Ciona intestinalis]
MVVLATANFFANTLVIASVFHKPRIFRMRADYIKMSLAMSDLFVGLQLVSISIPNAIKTLYSTPLQINMNFLQTWATPGAAIGCTFYMLTLIAPFDHLLYLSYNRFYAIKWPLKYKVASSRRPHWNLLIVWILIMTEAIFPVILESNYDFGYSPMVFLYLSSPSNVNSIQDFMTLMVTSICTLLLLFSITTFFTIATGFVVYKRGKTFKRTSVQKVNDILFKREKTAYKTLLMMEFGFILSLMPMLVLYILVFVDGCSVIGYLTCYYTIMLNSVINVGIYSVRDNDFRKFMANIRSKLPWKKKQPAQTTVIQNTISSSLDCSLATSQHNQN